MDLRCSIILPLMMMNLWSALAVITSLLVLTACSHTATTTPSSNSGEVTHTTTGSTTNSYEVQLIATWLTVPRAITWISEHIWYVTERWGDIYQIDDQGHKAWYAQIPNVRNIEEAGLMDIAAHPDYSQNHYIYLSSATDGHLQITRYTDTGTGLVSPTIILDMLPAAKYHAWWWITFWPDGMLYLSVGDATEKQKAQDTTSYHGKILRIRPDGSIPSDNPYSWSAIWSLWHRNVQWFDRSSEGEMYASEHGPSGFDGPWGGDEINHIVKWWNYGRPIVSHDKLKDGMTPAIATFTPAVAPASLIWYDGDQFPQRQDKLIIGTLKGESILILDPVTGQQVE